VRISSEGEILGECGDRDADEGYPKCLPRKRAESMSKEERIRVVRRKRNAEKEEEGQTFVSSDPDDQRGDSREVRIDRIGMMPPQDIQIKDGRLIGTAIINRAGVQVYYDRFGNRIRELRPAKEVEKAVKSFENLPITIDHPRTLVDDSTIEKVIKGLTGIASYGYGVTRSRMTLFSKDAINASRTSHQECSCGYTCDIVKRKGVWIDQWGVQGTPGEKYEYDQIQSNIQGNHVALVPQARAGDIAKFDQNSDRFTEWDESSLVSVFRVDSNTNIAISSNH